MLGEGDRERVLEGRLRVGVTVCEERLDTRLEREKGLLVPARRSEVEVDQLKHRLDVIRRRAAGESLQQGRDAGRDANPRSCQRLL